MAADSVSTSMAAELFHKMNPYKYKDYCATINERDSVSICFYKASKWVNYFALDTGLTFRNGKMNSDHVYEYFGKFNGVDAKTVRKNLLRYVSGNIDFVTKRSSVCLAMRNMDMETWIENINNGKPCDELALLSLSAMYHRHSIVVTKNKAWCTIESPKPMNLLQSLSACTVRLLYIGDLSFGVLKWKPTIPKPVSVKPHLGEFSIVEEYTLDEEKSTSKKLAVVKPTSVATAKCEQKPVVSVSLPSPEKAIHIPRSPPQPSRLLDVVKPKVVYAADNTEFYVGTGPTPNQELDPDTISPDSYPWKKELRVSVCRLSDFEISYWTGGEAPNSELNTVRPKKEVSSETVSLRTSVVASSRSHLKCEPLTDAASTEPLGEQSTEKLLAHAKSLIKRVGEALGTSDELKTKNEPTASPISTKNTDPTQYSVRTQRQVRVETSMDKQPVKCQMCSYSCTMVVALTEHHKNCHGVFKCNLCGKAFSSKPGLDKHMLLHINTMTFVCEECGQGFPFKSRLLQHKITHSTESRFLCKRDTCTKSFKNKGDLTHHEGTHDDKWYFCSSCSYKNKDKRNRDSHSRTHEAEGKECYHCEHCGKGMRFSTQMKRHRKSGCDMNTFHV